MEQRHLYRVTVQGRITERFATAFAGMRVIPGEGTTVLVGELEDQAALYGLLNRLRDLGLVLVALERLTA